MANDSCRADSLVMLIRAFQEWLKDQSLKTRLFCNGVVVAICLWLAFATGFFVFLVGALVIAVFTFNLDDARQARAWLNR
jgi:hypothetical protein